MLLTLITKMQGFKQRGYLLVQDVQNNFKGGVSTGINTLTVYVPDQSHLSSRKMRVFFLWFWQGYDLKEFYVEWTKPMIRQEMNCTYEGNQPLRISDYKRLEYMIDDR